MAKDKYDIHSLLYDLARGTIVALCPFSRLKKVSPYGKEHLKEVLSYKKGAVIAANHNGFSDPVVLAQVFWRRRVNFLAGENIMAGFKGAALRNAGCIKVDRNIFDFQSVKECISRLSSGKLLIIFPEGGISSEGENALKSGMTVMAIRAGVDIIPVYMEKRKSFFNRKRIIIGKPVTPSGKIPSRSNIEAVTAAVAAEEHFLRQWAEAEK